MAERPVLQTIGLYEIGPGGPHKETYVYYLLLSDQDIPERTWGPSPDVPTPTLDEMFNTVGLTGWYVFTRKIITDPDSFKIQARYHFPDLTHYNAKLLPRGLVWLPDPDHAAGYVDSLVCRQNSPGFQVRPLVTSHTFFWSGFGLRMTPNANVQFDEPTNTLQIAGTIAGDPIQVLFDGKEQRLGFYPPAETWNIPIALLGPTAGCIEFQIGLDQGTLQQRFGCAFSYFYRDEAGYASLAYPLFQPVKPSTQGTAGYLGFNVRLHPLHHLDSSQTRLALDLRGDSDYVANSLKLKSEYFRAVNGATMVLSPLKPSRDAQESPDMVDHGDAGFGFCKRPVPGALPSSPPETSYYLAPVGKYVLQGVINPAKRASKTLPPGTEVRWMCGLFGQEFVQIAVGDQVEFVSGRPAYAPGFAGTGEESERTSDGSPSSSGSALLNFFTTSWAKFPTEGTTAKRGYYAQPSASVYFAAAGDENYPTAVDALLLNLHEPVEFPIVPYAGIYVQPQSTAGRGRSRKKAVAESTSAPLPSVFAQFEAAVLSSVRHEQIAIPGRGPIFKPSRPILAGVATPERLGAGPTLDAAPKTALTPQGLLLHLHPDGEWQSVTLAQSPDNPNVLLQFSGDRGSPSLVSTDLSSMLVQNQLFLVVTRPGPLGRFDSMLMMGRFNFDLTIGAEQTLLLFKYNTSLSLRELVTRSSLWAGADTFVGDSDAILAAHGVIQDAISVAERDANAPGHPFEYFNQILDKKDWSGTLAFNCAINGNGMPPDLQMLLGGINGQLRAHHMGLEMNWLKPVSGGGLAIDRSSIFGVIHYDGALQPSGLPFDYAVETLTVVFSNSKVEQLAVRVGLTIEELFEREVNLISGSSPDVPNTLTINGQYQNQGTKSQSQNQATVGTVIFSSDTAFVYEFTVPENSTRVLDRIEITHASLTPVKSEALASPPGGTHVVASFSLSGELWFASEPFPNSQQLDLFSYGNPGKGGLTFSALTVYLDFTLNASGGLAPGKTATLQPALLTFTADPGAIRPGSLLGSLPLQFSRFWYAPEGLSRTQLGAAPVQCLQLEGHGSAASPMETGPFPFVATSPHYALEYDLPLGSLGSLSDVTVGITAKLLIAWGPSTVVPDNDAAALMIQLPAVFAGAGGFSLEGLLRTTFGDANLLKEELDGRAVYAILFSNIKFSVLGFSFPPGILIDFVIFAGQPATGQLANASNIAWFLAAQPTPKPKQLAL